MKKITYILIAIIALGLWLGYKIYQDKSDERLVDNQCKAMSEIVGRYITDIKSISCSKEMISIVKGTTYFRGNYMNTNGEMSPILCSYKPNNTASEKCHRLNKG